MKGPQRLPVRLDDLDIRAIIESILRFDPMAQIWLYGSRADSKAKGGDIDLLVVSQSLSISQRIDVLVAIKTRIGDQRLDLHIVAPKELNTDPLARCVLEKAIRLK